MVISFFVPVFGNTGVWTQGSTMDSTLYPLEPYLYPLCFSYFSNKVSLLAESALDTHPSKPSCIAGITGIYQYTQIILEMESC
jgi:hypothetical protein